jgi:hypothetical protein
MERGQWICRGRSQDGYHFDDFISCFEQGLKLGPGPGPGPGFCGLKRAFVEKDVFAVFAEGECDT